jgi:hypothetical protein
VSEEHPLEEPAKKIPAKWDLAEVVIGASFVAMLGYYFFAGNSSPAEPDSSTQHIAGSSALTDPLPGDSRPASPHGLYRPSVPSTITNEEVSYYNPNTGTSSTYSLDVDRDDHGDIQRVNFENGGWLEIDGMLSENYDGSETYTSESGAEYTFKRSLAPDDAEGQNGEQ